MKSAAYRDTLANLNQANFQVGEKRFGPFSLGISAGERIAILGPSGAGKSTILKMLAGEIPCHSGEVLINRRRIHCWPLAELSLQRAVLPQSHEVAFGLPAGLVIALGRVARHIDPKLQQIVTLAAELACADHLLQRSFDSLSGGERARVHIARVFAQLWDVESALLLVDEPLAALDPGLQFQLMEAIMSFAVERRHAVVAILHDINQATANFERIWMVKNGQLTGDYPASKDLLSQFEKLYELPFCAYTHESGQRLIFARSFQLQKETLKY